MTFPDSPRPTAPAELLESPLLRTAGFRHGFFTRRGGVSTGAYSSLNFTTQTGDEHAHVRENLRRAAAALGVGEGRVLFLTQVHGNGCVTVNAEDEHEAILQREGDVVLSGAPELACAVRTADCVPVLLACRVTGVVAACHAGWRGCVKDVIGAAVSALRARGAQELVAAVGPHISREAFEISEEVAREIAAASPDPEVIDRARDKPHADLRRVARAQLARAGVAPELIDDVFGCTFLEPEQFFSFRRDGAVSGRLLSAIVARPPAR